MGESFFSCIPSLSLVPVIVTSVTRFLSCSSIARDATSAPCSDCQCSMTGGFKVHHAMVLKERMWLERVWQRLSLQRIVIYLS